VKWLNDIKKRKEAERKKHYRTKKKCINQNKVRNSRTEKPSDRQSRYNVTFRIVRVNIAAVAKR
jgi:hypothetical protein